MSLVKSYIKNHNRTYSEMNIMISTENQEKLNKLFKVFLEDDFEISLINGLLEKEFEEIEMEYNINIKTMNEDELRKVMNVNKTK